VNISSLRMLLLVILTLFLPSSQAQESTPARPEYQATPQPSAQTPPVTQPPAAPGSGVYTIQRTTRLVVLDMVVVDSKGNVVKGLNREDFHVEEADQPQTVLNFEEAGAHMPDPQASIESTADLDRLAPRAPVNIILLDEFNTRFEDMAFARYSLKKYLEKQPDKLTTPTMLIAVDLQHFTVLRDYTQNKNELLSALDHHFAAYPWQAHQFAWIGERYALAFLTLRRVAEAVIGHPGHKNMIWIGRGFPAFNFANAPIDTAQRVNNAVQDCVNTLRDARVTLYTIDPAGVMVNPGAYGAAAAFNDPFGGEYQFNRLAKATGGRTLYGRNDVDAEIGTAIQDGGSFYTLTYRPTNDSTDPQKFRKIRVTLDRPGLSVITREGYYLRYGPGRVDPQNPSRRLVADLISADTSTMAYDGVPVTLELSPTDPDSFTVHVGARGLVWSYATDTTPRQSEVILMVSTFDHKGKELKRDAKVIKASAPGAQPTGRLERGLNIVYKIEPNPKAVRARFTVRVTASGRIGTADAALGQQAKQ
jgi:VWFA-related protein